LDESLGGSCKKQLPNLFVTQPIEGYSYHWSTEELFMDSSAPSKLLLKFCEEHSIANSAFSRNFENCYKKLIEFLVHQASLSHFPPPFLVGLVAPQGAGKTTLVKFFKLVLETCYELKVLTISLDDFYKTRAERRLMADKIHPLFSTRGVPGTHDVDLAISTIAAIKNGSEASTIMLPQFDKSIDDRVTPSQFRKIIAPPDIILFEGWCLNATPQSTEALVHPINKLEQELDPQAIWRTYVNTELAGSYQDLFSLIDDSITFYPPSFETVCQWRQQQESQLINSLSTLELTKSSAMRPQEIQRFMMHFERISRHQYINTSAKFTGTKTHSPRIQLDENRNTTLIL